jgi:HK97 family phage major capsid protein
MGADQIRAAIGELQQGAEGRAFSEDERADWNELNAAYDDLHERERAVRLNRLQELAMDGDSIEAGTGGHPAITSARSAGLATIERALNNELLRTDAADALDGMVRERDPLGLGSRYLAAVADPHYATAFGKLLADPTTGHLKFTPEEVRAVREVTQAEHQRAMVEGTTTAGGFGVPLALDPTILMSGSGTLNPIRGLARSVTIGGATEWQGISSDGVVAHWYAESAEASDDTPTLAGPVVYTRRASAFVPFSIELEADYSGGLQTELGKLLTDAKDVLEAQAFVDGLAANNAPVGILASTGGLGTTQRIQTAGSAAFAVGDNYLLKAALPARFIGTATIVGAPAFFDAVYRQAGGGSTEPQVMPDRGGQWIGVNKAEWSNLTYATTTGSNIAILASWKDAYVVVDRVGMAVELVPHIVGTNHRPVGQRGLFAYWRVGAGVLMANAARYLQVK